jgi:uncharacterized membrane protein YoaK (UPF0700 family)
MSDEPKNWKSERRRLILVLAIVSFACGALAVYALKN